MAARTSSGERSSHVEQRRRRQRDDGEDQNGHQDRDQEETEQELPRPPSVPRHIRFRVPQVVGLVLVSILPVLAVARLLDPRPRVAHASAGPVQLAVSAPARLRYRMTDWLQVDVRNPSSRPLESVTVELEAKFVEGFAQASFSPDVSRVDDQRYSVDVGSMEPGESRRVSVQLQAEKYGTRSGTVAVVADGSRAAVPVEVFVFP